MKSIKSIKKIFKTSLSSVFAIDEIEFIWNQWVVKEILNISLIDYCITNDFKITKQKNKVINLLVLHLLENQPIQYFFGYV